MNVTSMKPEQEMLRNLANLAETRAIRYRTSMKPEQEMLRNHRHAPHSPEFDQPQ